MKRVVLDKLDVVVALIVTNLLVLPFWPGLLSPDPVAQLTQGRAMKFDDWHPPVMSFFWAVIDRVWAGPAPMLVLQYVALWGCMILLLRRAGYGPIARTIIVVIVGAAPPVLMLVGTIWKDCQMALALVVTTTMIVEARRRGSNKLLYTALVPLWYATAVRHNALAATVPLAVLWVLVHRELSGRAPSLRKVGALAIALSIALYGLSTFATKALIGFGPSQHLGQALFWYDLAGMSVRVGEDLMPPQVHKRSPALNLAKLNRMYSAASVNGLIFSDVRFITQDEAELRELRDRWIGAIRAHPGAYLDHRLQVDKHAFGIGVDRVYYAFADNIPARNGLGVALRDGALTDKLMIEMRKVKDTAMFRAWPWMLACVLAPIVARRRRAPHADVVLAVCASGLLYALAYVVIAVSAEFRYVWWTALAAIVGWVFAAAPRRDTASSP